MNAHEEVERLLSQIRSRIQDPVVERASDQISVLCRGYMEPAKDLGWFRHGLTPAEGRLADLLLSRKGKCCSRSALMDVVYLGCDDEPDAKMIDVLVLRIRRKLAGTRHRIETIWGEGYMMKDCAPGEETRTTYQTMRHHPRRPRTTKEMAA